MTVKELIRKLEDCSNQYATVYIPCPTGGKLEVSSVDEDKDEPYKVELG